MTLHPCPLCGATNLEKCRYDRAFCLDSPVEIRKFTDKGEIFSISCGCGCSIDLHVDGLYTAWEITADPDAECSDDDLWEIAELCWNRRKEFRSVIDTVCDELGKIQYLLLDDDSRRALFGTMSVLGAYADALKCDGVTTWEYARKTLTELGGGKEEDVVE